MGRISQQSLRPNKREGGPTEIKVDPITDHKKIWTKNQVEQKDEVEMTNRRRR